VVFWVVASCNVVVEDGGSTVLRNNGIQPPHYRSQQRRKSRIHSSQQWKPQISPCTAGRLYVKV